MELVEAGQREDLLPHRIVRHANRAIALILALLLILSSRQLLLSIKTRSWQLREYVLVDRLFIIAQKELIHVLLELLLVHVVDPVILVACAAAHYSAKVKMWSTTSAVNY